LAQDDDGLILGTTPKQKSAAVFDLSNPDGVNIEVSLWGFVEIPGRYIVPLKTTFMDLLSFAGGPVLASNLKEIRIIRNSTTPGEKPQLIKLDYNDLLWEENITKATNKNPELVAGDVIVIMEERRYTFREDVGFYLPIFTTLFSIATLIITLTNK
jgi:protein involved in polysaccharide export with SLBB domain